MSKNKVVVRGMALAAVALTTAHAAHQNISTQSVLGVTYTLPTGWKAQAMPATSKKVGGLVTLEGQEFKFDAAEPPLSARMQVSRLSRGPVPVKDCELNHTFTDSLQESNTDFKRSADKIITLPHIKGCLTEFSYPSKRGFVMQGRIFSARDNTHSAALLVVSADQKTAQGLKSHTIRFKEMDTLLNSLRIVN